MDDIETFQKWSQKEFGTNGYSALQEYQINKEAGPTLEKLTITNCPEVRELYCSHNALTDLDISQLNQLTVLSYSDNRLSESKQAELAAKKLPEDNPTGNPIKTFDDDFFIDNEEITEIDISGEHGWEGKLEVKNCPNLTHLTVDNCKLDELVIENCPNLKHLSFRHNETLFFTGLSGLPNLEALYCSNNWLDELDLSNNSKLKHLVCDNNPIGNLEVKHLKDLESLYCFKCNLEELDVSDLKNLKELYCANNLVDIQNSKGLERLNIGGCDDLEILDCAESLLVDLVVENKPKLESISCKESKIESLIIKNCPSLQYLDISMQDIFEKNKNHSSYVEVDNPNYFKQLFFDKSTVFSNFPNLKTSRLQLYRVGEVVEKKNKERVYSFEQVDFKEIRNIERVREILINPNNYSSDDLLKLNKEDFEGVSDELKEKFAELIKKKREKEFVDELRKKLDLDELGRPNQKKDKKEETVPFLEKDNSSSEEETPLSTPTRELPASSEDKDQIILALQQKIAELENKIKKLETDNDNNNSQKVEEIRNEILNSELSEEQKQELLKLLEEKTKIGSETQSNSTNVWPWIIIGVSGVMVELLIVYFWQKKLKQKKKK